MSSIHTVAVHAGERAATPLPSTPLRASFTPVVTPIYHASSYVYDEMETLERHVRRHVRRADVHPLRQPDRVRAGGGGRRAGGRRGGAGLRLGHGGHPRHAAGRGYAGRNERGGGAGLLRRDLCAAEPAAGQPGRDPALRGHGRFWGGRGRLGSARAAGAPAGALIVETISNPLLKVADLPTLAELAHAAGAALIVDNTFASPYLCRPLGLGADYVVHDATKYLGGHGDVLGGVTVTGSAVRRRELNEVNKLVGANLGPQEAWLVLRGIKTLPLRVQRQCENASQVAAWLAGHPTVSRVNYPGLAFHPQHALAARLLERGAFGAMISFDIRDGDRARVFRFMEALRLVLPATTLGDVYSLALYPAHSSHRALDPDLRRRIGIGDGLVRLSVGIEDPRTSSRIWRRRSAALER